MSRFPNKVLVRNTHPDTTQERNVRKLVPGQSDHAFEHPEVEHFIVHGIMLVALIPGFVPWLLKEDRIS